MDTFIHSIATVVPDTIYLQADAGERMKLQYSTDRKLERLVHRVYSQSGIEKRHSVVKDFVLGAPEGPFYDSETHTLKSPSTKVRNELYTEEAKKLFVCAAQKVLWGSSFTPEDITHVITVSCTGFFAPGPDYFVVKALGLPAHTHRYHVGFMGCFAAFPALKMAQAFCETDPNAVVLVVSLELCSLHLQRSDNIDTIVAASVFADGGAAALLSAKAPSGPALRAESFATAITPTGEEDMAWTVGDNGFDIVLSTYVPSILEANISTTIEPLLAQASLTKSDITHWAVHPGGRAILDKVRDGLLLGEAQLEVPRAVLRAYGNMSSATILFVLEKLLERAQHDEKIYAMAFGPGLTVESGLFTKV
ncbi:MAG: type III polyketide synthase [Trueperaceae bacterium]